MKKILMVVLILMMALIISGCNKQLFDTTYKFDRAIIWSPVGIIAEGKVDSWTDFKDGDQIQVKIDGKIYLSHSSNVVLIHD